MKSLPRIPVRLRRSPRRHPPASLLTRLSQRQFLFPPEPVTVPKGTLLNIRLTESVSSDVNQPGDTFLASLASPVMVNDSVVIPAEAGIQGKIVDVRSAGHFSGRPELVIGLTAFGLQRKDLRLTYQSVFQAGAIAKHSYSRSDWRRGRDRCHHWRHFGRWKRCRNWGHHRRGNRHRRTGREQNTRAAASL